MQSSAKLLTAPSHNRPWILWGSELPCGSLKAWAFEETLKTYVQSGCENVVDIVAGSSAKALNALCDTLGLGLHLVVHQSLKLQMHDWGLHRKCHFVQDLKQALDLVEDLCRRLPKVQYLDQMRNAKLSESLARKLRECLSLEFGNSWPEWDRIISGLGSGTTLMALKKVFPDQRVLGLQGPPTGGIPGWRHYGTQNFGSQDILTPFLNQIELMECDAKVPLDPYSQLLAQVRSGDESKTLLVVHSAPRDLECQTRESPVLVPIL